MTPFPQTVRIETAGRCNFTCRHCSIRNLRDVLSFLDFVRIMDSLPAIPNMLLLNHGGEPMLNRDLEAIVSHAKHRGVKKVVMNTNASLIRPIPGAELNVSFDGTTPAENDEIRRGSNFAKHAPKVLEVAKKQKVTIYNVQKSGGKKPAPAKYLTDYFGKAVHYETDPMRLWPGQEQMMGSTVSASPRHPTFCPSLFEGFHILSNGDVVKCCEDLNGEYTYGNVFEESPLSIWERMQVIRDNFAKKKYPEQCQKCHIVTGAYYAEAG